MSGVFLSLWCTGCFMISDKERKLVEDESPHPSRGEEGGEVQL